MKSHFVIKNRNGEFFSGTWAQISWTAEYPSARVYNIARLAKQEARKLSVECADLDLPVKLFESYGEESEREVEF